MSLENTPDIPSAKWVTFGLVFLIVSIATLIYLPGLKGPFIFDDLPNIVYNKNIQITEISYKTLSEAAHSLHSGPLGRPLAGVSFAINYYFANGTENTFGFKAFNLAIHILNGLLIFWLVLIISKNLLNNASISFQYSDHNKIVILSGLAALIWVVHPIQVTSVLYVVQRMTSMAAMFMLLSIILYIYARLALDRGNILKSSTYFFTALLSGVTAFLCKETALLLPLYLILTEFFLFSNSDLWAWWRQLSKSGKTLLSAGLICILLLAVVSTIEYALPGYAHRDFNMLERVLTESRILIFYLAQSLIPRLSGFGLYHDDIPLSTSLISPWTTLPSIVIILSLLFLAIRYYHRFPLVSFGILWFFISHVLESTVFALELVHEHRNYLASLGPVLIIAFGLFILASKFQKKKLWILVPLIIVGFATTTAVRSMQWMQLKNLLEAETFYHPQSPRAWADLFFIQTKENMPDEAIASILKAIHLKPSEPGYYLSLYLYTKPFDSEIASFANSKLLEHIRDNPESKVMTSTLHRIHQCLDSSCKDMQKDFGRWIREALKYSNSPRLKYYHGSNLYAQGNLEESLKLLDESIRGGKAQHASPIIKRIYVLLALKKIDLARTAYVELQELNKKHTYVSISAMQEIQNAIAESEQPLLR